MPHLLIAGATGSGKSVCINSILLSLLYQNSPDQLKLILVDPKRVEMPVYNDIPHLITPVVTNVNKTINALRWVVAEMDRRFDLLSKHGQRNIADYNHAPIGDQLPYIVVVIDELADLMAVAMHEVESAIIRLAQMARAVGIHLVVATQRPSVDVITGLIKANITSRIAFSVASVVDSRTILDTSGAEKLLGKGDMLFVTAQLSKPRRLQGVFVSNDEIERVTNFLREQGKPDYHPEVVEKLIVDETLSGNFEDLGDDELLSQAKDLVIKAGKASASLLQRRLRVGYARAARLLDLLEEQGVIGPGDGAKPREILVRSTPSGLDVPVDTDEAVADAPEEEGDETEDTSEQKYE
ncbi:MAG: DNA translocase FtsK [Patescibacteria group bacterium]|jgi:S-DNA-T family DNA segregation ATPase FtsK/SpoIIIE